MLLTTIYSSLNLLENTETDMENVMSVPSFARVKFQSWGKLSALNILCFVVNALFSWDLAVFLVHFFG